MQRPRRLCKRLGCTRLWCRVSRVRWMSSPRRCLVSDEETSHAIVRHLADYVLLWTTRWRRRPHIYIYIYE